MKLAFFITFLPLLCASCASLPAGKTDRSNFSETVSLGIYLNNSESGLAVAYVDQSSNTSEYLKNGDIILSINNKILSSRREYISELSKYTPDDAITITYLRSGKTLKCKVKPVKTAVRKDLSALFKHLSADKSTNLAIIATALNGMIKDPEKQISWQENIRMQLLTSLERDYLNAFNYDSLFGIVDRNKLDDVLRELRLGATGIISQSDAAKIGLFAGATHILFADMIRSGDSKSKGGFKDTTSLRLIEVQTSKVAASLSY